jgi:hypothetical protein
MGSWRFEYGPRIAIRQPEGANEMRAMNRQGKQGSLILLPLVLGGCAAVLPLIPVVVSLGGAGLATFAVVAGVPSLQSGVLNTDDSGLTDLVGRGTLELDASAVSLDSSSTSSKRGTTTQQAPTCAEACALAGVDSTTCANVCDENQIEITVWIAAPENVGTVCTGGDRDTYGPYLVSLDENGNGTAVSPSEVDLTARTVALINAGELAACLQVIAPDDGEVLIDSLTINVGL